MQIQFLNIPKSTSKLKLVWQDFAKNSPAFTSIQDFSPKLNKRWKNILVLGIGGSSLGAQALISGLRIKDKGERIIHFLDNLDPDEISVTFKSLNWKKTLVLVISKSGSTLETIAQFLIVKAKLGKNWRAQAIFITDPGRNFLRDLAAKEKVLCFDVPEKIGGRYSVFTNVGLVPAALTNVNIPELLNGAKTVQSRSAFEFAKIHAAEYKRGRNITVFCPYSSQLKKLGEWYAQLLAESVGKNSKIGITPEVSLGATDQHSKLQLWMEGPADKFFIFLNIQKFEQDLKIPNPPAEFNYLKNKSLAQVLQTEFEATTQALTEKKRPLVKITLPKLDAHTLGHLMQFFMLEVYFLGKILSIDPFNQPGVERGKVLAKKALARN